MTIQVLAAAILIASLSMREAAAEGFELVTREAWGAKPAIQQRMTEHRPSGLIIHHTSVAQQPKLSLERKMSGLQAFSQRPGKVGKRRKPAWGDVPYHYYIGVSGRIAEGRSLQYAGDTNTNYSTSGWIQVVVEGDFTKEKPAQAQLAALRALTTHLKTTFGITGARITAHDDHASTNCPGSALKRYLPTLR